MKFKINEFILYIFMIIVCNVISVYTTKDTIKNKYSLQPKTTVQVFYTETCQCGYDKAEVDYSIVSDKGYFECPNCGCNYEFSKGDK